MLHLDVEAPMRPTCHFFATCLQVRHGLSFLQGLSGPATAVVRLFQGGGDVKNDPRLQIVDFLPRLRRFSYALTGDSDKGDDLVQETCARALSRINQWEPGTRLDSWMFRIAQNIWFDQRRAHKVRGDSVDIDQAYDIAGADGREVTENRLTLQRGIERYR